MDYISNSITPAPWEISDYSCCDGDGKYDICFQIGRSDTGETIAELNGEGEKNYKHIKRNAELVRAAPEIAEMLAKVKWAKYIRFSCDTAGMIEPLRNAVKLLRTAGYRRDIFVYVLAQELEESLERINKICSIDSKIIQIR